jgi:hypothetical protein
MSNKMNKTADKAKRKAALIADANANIAACAAMQNEWRQACANNAEFTPYELWLSIALAITPQAARDIIDHDTINALAIVSNS